MVSAPKVQKVTPAMPGCSARAWRTVVTAISVAASSGYPKMPVEMAGKATVSMPCSAASASVFR